MKRTALQAETLLYKATSRCAPLALCLFISLPLALSFAPQAAHGAGVVYSFIYSLQGTANSLRGIGGSVDPLVGKVLLSLSIAASVGASTSAGVEEFKREEAAKERLLRLLKSNPKRVSRALLTQEGRTYAWLIKHIAKLDKPKTRRPVFDCLINERASQVRRAFKIGDLVARRNRLVLILKEAARDTQLMMGQSERCGRLLKEAREEERAQR